MSGLLPLFPEKLRKCRWLLGVKGKEEQCRERSSALSSPRCRSYWKWSLLVAHDYGHQLYLLIIMHSIYEVCLKISRTCITKNLFQFQTMKYMFPLQGSLMHFQILHCHISMHCWKDSSVMFLNSNVAAFLIPFKHSNCAPWEFTWVWRKDNNP